MSTTNDQIGIASDARKYGVPSLTITWTGYGATGSGATSRSATVFGNIHKTTIADRSQGEDNAGEVQNLRRRNLRFQISVEATPIASSIAGALAIAADLPMPMQILTVTSTDDPQIDTTTASANTAICDSASTRYTPDGHAVIDFTISIWVNKVFVAQTA